MTSDEPRFETQWLRWNVRRRSHSFRAYVVEPYSYNPTGHKHIFNHIINNFFSPIPNYVDSNGHTPPPLALQPYDLLVFPEIFVPAHHLLDVLNNLPPASGCIHTGLRPTTKKNPHLFSCTDLQSLLTSLRTIPHLESTDLDSFSQWLSLQAPTSRFNISCLFTAEANGHIRICLHPKLVRSKFEYWLNEQHLSEANLLSLVTLQPTSTNIDTITIQPLICADVLDLPTDRPNNHPIPAISHYRDSFPSPPPEYIDIVSVTTATPSSSMPDTFGGTHTWSSQFREAFIRAARSFHTERHHHATFILANYKTILADHTGGLSGIFTPVKRYRTESYLPYIAKRKTVYGSFPEPAGDEEDTRWISADDDRAQKDRAKEYAHIISLAPNAWPNSALALLFGFTITRLPRTAGRSYSCQIADCTLHELTRSDARDSSTNTGSTDPSDEHNPNLLLAPWRER